MHVMGFRLSLSAVVLATVIAWLGHPAESAMATLPGPCTDRGTGGEVVLCEEFESGSLRARWDDGGVPTIWPAAFVFCADGFGFGDRCAAWSTARAVFAPLPELYVRWYEFISKRQMSGAPPDPSLMLGDPSNTVKVAVGRVQTHAQRVTLDPGRWYLFEWHVKLNSPGVPDGLSELWIDDASRPITAQTLRLHQSDVQWLRRADAGKLLGVLRLAARGCDDAPQACPAGEATSPHASHRWDHIVVSRAPIGPLTVGRRPRAPTGLRIGG